MTTSGKIIRFGVFEIDAASGSLRKNGTRVRLQDQPARVLLHLLEHRGAVVTREELQRALWPGDTFVDFDHGLNTAVNKIRDALGDSASSPRFIETVPKKGYRFIAPVEEVQPAAVVRQPRPKWIWAALGLVVAATAAVAWLARDAGTSATEPVLTPLTTLPGWELLPSLSPDGDRVAFGYSDPRATDGWSIYVKQIGSEQLLPITTGPADTSPAWSPDGRKIAFARWVPGGRYTLYVAPSMGGPERKVGEFQSNNEGMWLRVASWGPDGKWMVVADGPDRDAGSLYSLSLATGVRHRLTTGSGRGDTDPAVSPDGSSVAFVRRIGSQQGALYLQRLTREHAPSGEPVPLFSGPQNPRSPAWTPDGQIVFQSGWWHLPILARISPRGGSPVRLAFAGEFAGSPTISSRGDRLCFVRFTGDINIWALTLGESGVWTKEYWSGSSTYLDGVPHFSPDGRRVAFISNRTGPQALWVSDADGSHAVRLTEFTDREVMNADWAPDGKTLFFVARKSWYAVSSDGGTPREAIVPGHQLHSDGSTSSKDGKWWYFASDKTGRSEIWKAPIEGGAATPVTRSGGRWPRLSEDGKYLYYSALEPDAGLWRIPADGGREQKIIESLSTPSNYQVTELGIYFIPRSARAIRLLRFATGKTETLAELDKPPMWGLSVSPDRRRILFTQHDQFNADLMLVENFR